MRTEIFGIIFGLTAIFSSQASTISLAEGSDTLLWDFSIQTLKVKIDDNSAGFSKTTFDLGWMTVDDAIPAASVDSFDLGFAGSDAYGFVLSSEAEIGSGTYFYEPLFPDFPAFVYFVGSGDPTDGTFGSDNYIGFSLQNGADTHYGWLRFDFQPYSSDGVALTFLEGYINDIPGASVEAGVIPEPSTFALLSGGLALLPLYRRFRRKS